MSNALREILAANIRGVEAPGSLYKKAADELSLEIMQLRAIAKEQHEALVRANNSLSSATPVDRSAAAIKEFKEYCLAASDCRAAIAKYEAMQSECH